MRIEPEGNTCFTMISDLIERIDPNSAEIAELRLRQLDVIELFEACINPASRAILDLIMQESYRHANGFYRISFPATSSSPVRIRLHVWPSEQDPGSSEAVPDAHNHKWPFASRVLAGALSHDILHVRLGHGPYEHFRHVDMGYGYEFIRSGRASLDLVRVEVTTEGTAYRMVPETVHRVLPQDGQYAATLVAELERLNDTTDVFAEDNRHGNEQIRPQRLRVEEIATEFRRVICALEGRSSA